MNVYGPLLLCLTRSPLFVTGGGFSHLNLSIKVLLNEEGNVI